MSAVVTLKKGEGRMVKSAFSAEKKIQLLMKHFSGHDCSRHGNTGKRR